MALEETRQWNPSRYGVFSEILFKIPDEDDFNVSGFLKPVSRGQIEEIMEAGAGEIHVVPRKEILKLLDDTKKKKKRRKSKNEKQIVVFDPEFLAMAKKKKWDTNNIKIIDFTHLMTACEISDTKAFR